jgi:hypothetical protein
MITHNTVTQAEVAIAVGADIVGISSFLPRVPLMGAVC